MNKAQEIGARIGEAVRLTGQTNRQFAKGLGVSAPTLGRYITGETEPPAATMARIAELSGRPIAWFYQEQDVEAGQEVAATLVRIFGNMMGGRQPDEAFDLETHSPLWLNPRVREFLRSQADGMRAAIERVAGRPWDAIDGAEKQRVLQEFVRMVLPEEDLGLRRGESDDGSSSRWPLPAVETPGR